MLAKKTRKRKRKDELWEWAILVGGRGGGRVGMLHTCASEVSVSYVFCTHFLDGFHSWLKTARTSGRQTKTDQVPLQCLNTAQPGIVLEAVCTQQRSLTQACCKLRVLTLGHTPTPGCFQACKAPRLSVRDVSCCIFVADGEKT